MGFFEYYRPKAAEVARNAVCASVDEMVASFAPATRARFEEVFASPMAQRSKVASWRDLPMDRLADLHDLCARSAAPDDTTPAKGD